MVNFLRKLNLWVILCTFLAYAAPFVSPASVSLLLFAGLAYPWLLLLNLIFIALWAISRYRYWWFSTATVLIGWTYLTGIFGIHFFKNTEGSRSPQTLRVLTYNLNDLSLRSIKNKFDGRQQFNAFIEQQNADVMCLQEFDTKTTAIQKQIEFLPILTTYPYILRDDKTAVCIYSRLPIVSNGTIFKAKDSNGCLFADIQIGEQTVRFYDVQLFSNNVSDIADNLVEQGTIVDDKAARSVGRMLARVRRTAINRAKEVELVKNHAAHSPFQTIICGDLNDIPVSYTYHTLHDGLQDAFQLTGSGVGTTYAGNIPALRIDYIFTSPNIVPVRCEVPHVPFSDHFPVVGDFILK